jgi:site-specific recombinase XerD
MRIPEVIPHFKRYLIFEKNVTPKYVKGIIQTLELLEKETNCTQIKQYTTDVISSFLCGMRAQRLWSPKTFRNYRQNLKSFFDFAKRKSYISLNPVDIIEKPRLPQRLPRCLSKQQVSRLISELHCYQWKHPLEYHRNSVIIYMFLYTGLRLNELLQLKTHEVNFEELSIFVNKGKGNKDRYVPIHPKLLYKLKGYLKKRNKKLKPSPYFFSSYRSEKPLTNKNLDAVFKKLSDESGFHITPHMLRHTMAKLSLEANLNAYKLKEILGHSNIATTQIYMSVSTENIRKSFNTLELL